MGGTVFCPAEEIEGVDVRQPDISSNFNNTLGKQFPK